MAGGTPLADHKLIYGQAFGIYGFSEYYRATGEQAALHTAVALYHLIEQHAADPKHGGYFDAFYRDWSCCPETNVDQAPGQVLKTMNTHLHILEAYTNLLHAWPDAGLRARQHALARLLLTRIIDRQTGHLKLHFDAAWQSLTPHISYGHDIEASWLLVEAAEQLGDEALLAEVTAVATHIAHVTLQEGVDSNGGIFNEGDAHGVCDRSKDWWPQAEGQFVQRYLIDRQHGEWFAEVTADGQPGPRDKAGIWKTPYHNGRACLELMQRV
jgi:mannobiose 2-epimerase